ncbi:MAG: chloramphenicol acetyltransferase [Bacteroidota bacterium]
MKTELDLKNWNRYEHFKFFSAFDEPFYGITVRLDCTKTYQLAKQNKESFFLSYLHKSLVAVNSIANFRYRIEDGKVFEYQRIDASPTINRPDGTFGFSYLKYDADFKTFRDLTLPVIQEVRESKGLVPGTAGQNVIHYSSLPWLDFTSLSHARHFSFGDSCPKISFGQMKETNGRFEFPVSIHAHHALVDGIHIGQFVERFQELLNAQA